MSAATIVQKRSLLPNYNWNKNKKRFLSKSFLMTKFIIYNFRTYIYIELDIINGGVWKIIFILKLCLENRTFIDSFSTDNDNPFFKYSWRSLWICFIYYLIKLYHTSLDLFYKLIILNFQKIIAFLEFVSGLSIFELFLVGSLDQILRHIDYVASWAFFPHF